MKKTQSPAGPAQLDGPPMGWDLLTVTVKVSYKIASIEIISGLKF